MHSTQLKWTNKKIAIEENVFEHLVWGEYFDSSFAIALVDQFRQCDDLYSIISMTIGTQHADNKNIWQLIVSHIGPNRLLYSVCVNICLPRYHRNIYIYKCTQLHSSYTHSYMQKGSKYRWHINNIKHTTHIKLYNTLNQENNMLSAGCSGIINLFVIICGAQKYLAISVICFAVAVRIKETATNCL